MIYSHSLIWCYAILDMTTLSLTHNEHSCGIHTQGGFQVSRDRENLKKKKKKKDEKIDWAKDRLEFIGCFRMLSNCANFSSPGSGSVNDLLLHPFFNMLETAQSVICSRQFMRSDDLITTAYVLIANLTKDSYRAMDFIQRLDLYAN